jgi:hypothetical protein
MLITVVTKYDGPSAEIFVGAIAAPLSAITAEHRRNLRQALDCDGEGETDPDEDDDASNLFFRELEVAEFKPEHSLAGMAEILNADGESS